MLFQGCIYKGKYNYVSYKYATCVSKHDVGIKLQNGIYKCVYRKNNKIVYQKPKKVVRVVKKKIVNRKYTFKNPSWLNTASITKCETTITTVYKDGAIRCKGKILEVGQVSIIKRINK